MRASALKMISLGCRLMTSTIGVRSILRSATSRAKIGVSKMLSRIHRPMPTRMMLSRNGTRQPQLRN